MSQQESVEFAREEIKRISTWLAEAEYHWNVFTAHMESGELREYKEKCQRQEKIMNILEKYVAICDLLI